MSVSIRKLLTGLPLLLIALTACAQEYGLDYTVYIDPDFPAEDQGAGVQAVAVWENALGKDIHLSTGIRKCEASDFPLYTTKRMICIQPCSVEWINRQTDEYAVGATIRKGDNDSSNVYIPVLRDTGYSSATMTQILAHELGHAFGLAHISQGLMFWSIDTDNSSATPTCGDMSQYLDLRHMSRITPECPEGGNYTYYH